MGDELRLVRTSDATWDQLVDRCGNDFYHRRNYHEMAESEGEGEAYLAVFGDDDRFIAWPFLRRAIDGSTAHDATCVYGYAGPVSLGIDFDSPSSEEFLARAWKALKRCWTDQGIVSLFTRFHPLLENRRLARAFAGEPIGPTPAVLTLGRSVSMDLDLSSEERLRSYDRDTRYEIRRAERHGLAVHDDPGFEHLGVLVDLYHQTMLRNSAEERYLFSLDYFERLVEVLGGAARTVVATYEGEIAGGLLFVVRGEFAAAHLTGLSNEHLRLSPLKTLLHAAANRARSLGATRFHLGAGRGGAEDSLFEFKRRLAPIEHEFVIGRWVLDQRRYCELANIDGRNISESRSAFFPAYRAPRPAP